jgi:uncharacterized protein YndB with AHSA1/START domain
MSVADIMKIEREIVVGAPIDRVWRALTDEREFAVWFQTGITGKFAVGAEVGMICEGYPPFKVWIEVMEAPRRFGWRWHPGAVQPPEDVAGEPTTQVVFTLEAVEGGTRVRVLETGFDQVSLRYRAKAFAENTEGWKIQMARLEEHVRKNA